MEKATSHGHYSQSLLAGLAKSFPSPPNRQGVNEETLNEGKESDLDAPGTFWEERGTKLLTNCAFNGRLISGCFAGHRRTAAAIARQNDRD